MKINELTLVSFGKFNNKKIILEDGMNIIYGENEAGKTTVHKFIEGMFFGFFKPYRKRKVYTDEFDKYMPFDRDDYYGMLKYKHQGQIYRVERNFSKDNGEVKIFDDSTGSEITSDFEYDKVTRLYDPSSVHLNLNRVVFSNTISIGQLDCKTDNDLIREVENSLINLGASLDSDLSVQKVIEKLEMDIENIGTEKRVRTSPYGKVLKKIEDLEKDKKCAHESLLKINEYMLDLNNIKSELKTLRDKKDNIIKTIEVYEKTKRYKSYKEIINLENEIEITSASIKSNLNIAEISSKEYNDILDIDRKITLLDQEIKDATRKEELINEKSRPMFKELDKLLELNLNEDIDFDIYNYDEKTNEVEKLKDIKDKLDKKMQSKSIEVAIEHLKNIKNKRNILTILLFIFLVLSFINVRLFFLPVFLSTTLTYLIMKERKIKSEKIKLERIQRGIYRTERNLKLNIDKLEQKIYDIMNKHSSINKTELLEKKNSLEKQKELLCQKDDYLKQRKEICLEKEKLTKYYQDLKLDLNYLLDKNQFKSVEQLEYEVENRQRDKEKIPVLESKRYLRDNLISKVDIEKLKNEFKDVKEDGLYICLENIDINKLNKELKEIDEKVLNKKNELCNIESKIEILQMESRNLVTIKEEISNLQAEKQQYEEELQSLNLAKETLETVSKNIKKEFSPKLNMIVSELISDITDKKYTEVKIEENLNIKIVDNKSRLIDLSFLSGGTIEQIYFSTRIGIDQVIRNEEKHPLILDDTFIQYDDYRLKNILKFLYKESLKRQVIIFTCQKREMETLDKLNIKYSLTKL